MPVFHFHTEPLRDEWLDAYGHLNEAFYLVPFSNASWKMQEFFGIGVEYFRECGCALYTLETHLRYVREVRAPAELAVETRVFAVDAKRLHFAHILSVDGETRATGEFMGLHYDTRAARAAAFAAKVQETLQCACVDALPEWAGRRVGFARG